MHPHLRSIMYLFFFAVVFAGVVFFIVSTQRPTPVPVAMVASPAPLVPKVDYSRGKWRTILQWPVECENNWRANQPDNVDGGVVGQQLNQSESILFVTCDVTAFQNDFYVYYYNQDTHTAKLQKFDVFNIGEAHRVLQDQITLVPGTPTFDTNTKVLKILTIDRPDGGCGSQAKYQLVDQNFVLQEFRAQFECEKPNQETNPDLWQVMSVKKK